MMMPDNIADAVQLILDEKGITQQELSMRMGVSRAALRKWCGRKMDIPKERLHLVKGDVSTKIMIGEPIDYIIHSPRISEAVSSCFHESIFFLPERMRRHVIVEAWG